MKTALTVAGAAIVAAGVVALPSAALAAADAHSLVALTQRDQAGKTVLPVVKPGQTVDTVIGVKNASPDKQTVVAHLRVLNDMALPRTATNCVYYVDSNLDGAWCEFGTELDAGKTYGTVVPVTIEPQAKKLDSFIFQWYAKDHADKNGGIEGLARQDSDKKADPVRGAGAALTLEPKALPDNPSPAFVGFAWYTLQLPPAPPTAPSSPTPSSPSATRSSAPAAAAAGAGAADDTGTGGLAVTGTDTATIAGAGAALLLLGAGAFVLARRRTRA